METEKMCLGAYFKEKPNVADVDAGKRFMYECRRNPAVYVTKANAADFARYKASLKRLYGECHPSRSNIPDVGLYDSGEPCNLE